MMATSISTERVLVFDPRYTLVLLNAPSSFKSKQDSQQGEDMRAAQHVRTLFKHLGLLSPKDGKSVVKFSTPPVRIPRAQTPKKCQGRELSILLAFTNESDVRKVLRAWAKVSKWAERRSIVRYPIPKDSVEGNDEEDEVGSSDPEESQPGGTTSETPNIPDQKE